MSKTQAAIARCYNCLAPMRHVFDDLSTQQTLDNEQWDNALVISLEGGYGMFIDPIPHDEATDFRLDTIGPKDAPEPERGILDKVGEKRVVICHDCAHQLCEAVPWVKRLVNPLKSHAHRHGEDWSGHEGWDLPHVCPQCQAPTEWDESKQAKACPRCSPAAPA